MLFRREDLRAHRKPQHDTALMWSRAHDSPSPGWGSWWGTETEDGLGLLAISLALGSVYMLQTLHTQHVHTHIHMHVRTHTYTHIQTCIHTCAHPETHVHTCAHTDMQTHAYIPTHTHTLALKQVPRRHSSESPAEEYASCRGPHAVCMKCKQPT